MDQRARLDLDELTLRFLTESDAADRQFRDNMSEFRRQIADDRDALKWVAAFAAAGLFSAAGPLREHASPLLALAAVLFLVSILGAVGHIFLVDLHASGLLAASVDEGHDSAKRLLDIRNKANDLDRALAQDGEDAASLRQELAALTQERLDAIVAFATTVKLTHRQRLGSVLAIVGLGGAAAGLLVITLMVVIEVVRGR